jgi:PAS domain-containing protein
MPPAGHHAPDPAWLRQAVDASGEIVFMTDRKGLFTFVNPTFERCYGYAWSEVVGRVTPRVLKGGEAVPDPAFWHHGQTVERAFSIAPKTATWSMSNRRRRPSGTTPTPSSAS